MSKIFEYVNNNSVYGISMDSGNSLAIPSPIFEESPDTVIAEIFDRANNKAMFIICKRITIACYKYSQPLRELYYPTNVIATTLHGDVIMFNRGFQSSLMFLCQNGERTAQRFFSHESNCKRVFSSHIDVKSPFSEQIVRAKINISSKINEDQMLYQFLRVDILFSGGLRISSNHDDCGEQIYRVECNVVEKQQFDKVLETCPLMITLPTHGIVCYHDIVKLFLDNSLDRIVSKISAGTAQ